MTGCWTGWTPGAGQMFGSVDFAMHVQNFLGARDGHVVDELLAVVAEAGTVACAGEFRHPGAARAAVEVEAELRTEAPQDSQFGRVDLDRKSTRLNSSHLGISYAVFCLK